MLDQAGSILSVFQFTRKPSQTIYLVFFFPILLSFYFALDKANITPVTKAKIALIKVSPVEGDKFSEQIPDR